MRFIDADALTKRWTIASPEPYSTDAIEVIASIDEAPTMTADAYFDAVDRIRPCPNCRYTLLGALKEENHDT